MNAWAVYSVWNDGCWDDPQANCCEVFRDKEQARARVRLLLDGCPWRRATDYQIRRTSVPKGRCFEERRL